MKKQTFSHLFLCLSIFFWNSIECKPSYSLNNDNGNGVATRESHFGNKYSSHVGTIPRTNEDKLMLYDFLVSQLTRDVLFEDMVHDAMYSKSYSENAFHNVLVGMQKLKEMNEMASKPDYYYNPATSE